MKRRERLNVRQLFCIRRANAAAIFLIQAEVVDFAVIRDDFTALMTAYDNTIQYGVIIKLFRNSLV